MHKISIIIAFIGFNLFMAGCTKTWNGVKQDSSKAWNTSKKAVHNATK